MVRRSTLILLAVFVLLLGAFLLFQRTKGASTGDDFPDELGNLNDLQPVKLLFQVPPGEVILGIEVMDRDENSLEIIRGSGSEDWEFANLEEDADQEVINRAIAQLESLTVEGVLDTDIEMEVIGLATPANTIRLLISNGGYFTIYVGDVTITNTAYYAQLKGQPPEIVTKYNLDSAINLLNNPPIYVEPTPTPSQ